MFIKSVSSVYFDVVMPLLESYPIGLDQDDHHGDSGSNLLSSLKKHLKKENHCQVCKINSKMSNKPIIYICNFTWQTFIMNCISTEQKNFMLKTGSAKEKSRKFEYLFSWLFKLNVYFFNFSLCCILLNKIARLEELKLSSSLSKNYKCEWFYCVKRIQLWLLLLLALMSDSMDFGCM